MVALRGEANLRMLISTMNRCGRGRARGRAPLGHENAPRRSTSTGHRFLERDDELAARLDERRARARGGPGRVPTASQDEGGEIVELRK
jgi:hypothetical protein